MILNDTFFLFFLLSIFFLTFFLNFSNSLFFLLIAEIMWILLYAIVVYLSYQYNNIVFLALTFIFLILSAIEFSIGVIIIFIQFLILKSVKLSNNNDKFNYFFRKYFFNYTIFNYCSESI